MISVLIPLYQEDISSLISSLLIAIQKVETAGEIVISDVSPQSLNKDILTAISPRIRYFHHTIQKNRAQNRNFLADQAQFDLLVFLDCDAILPDENYLLRYIESVEENTLVCGGTSYQENKPTDKNAVLRWIYGKSREVRSAQKRSLNPYNSFSSFNFCAPLDVFNRIRFDENITEYGHEDTFFGYSLKEKGITVKHIDNQLIHNGLDATDVFLKKTRTSVRSLVTISLNEEIPDDFLESIQLWRTYLKVKRLGLTGWVRALSKILLILILWNLKSAKPNVRFLDLYKLVHLVKIQG